MGEGPIRVLHVLRSDHATHTGGDLVQIRQTVAALIRAGVDARASTVRDYHGPAPDVVHLYNFQLPVALRRDLAAARARWPGSRVAVSPIFWHLTPREATAAPDPSIWWRTAKSAAKNRLAWTTGRQVLTSCDAVLPNGASELRRTARYFRVRPDERWAVVPNGVDLRAWPMRIGPPDRSSVLSSCGLDPAGAPVIACVGRVEPRKNQLAVVRAVAGLPGSALLLVGPVGDEPYAARVRRALAPHRERMAWLGSRTPDEILRLFGGVDVHVLASLFETPGLVSLEAAAAGCEVVIGTGGSPAEYFAGTAHVAGSTRASSVRAAIVESSTAPRQPATRRQVERFDWSETAQVLASVYARLTAR